ncbi:Uncharacterized conserved protein YlxW, UPF0749 family [Natronincola peptidivorans]|uniref:Uncharacterized conserved protein YlxW, UPF0749 family n=1 Tax=Natronincola peptidivorans TaxID=426128 RepID=A0A1H9Y775_9FIRM|nr:DUF881 domain-containing protein [Natronincola peptidivorans]SES64760.1 Uncharacterized conserved protein YlxW, UPF0749 family [Natronincola peptidivorans]
MKAIYQNTIIMLMFIILGFTIVLQFRNDSEDYSFISAKTLDDLQGAISKEREEINNIKRLIVSTEEKLNEYQRALEEEGSIKEVLINDINTMKLISGFTDVEGPGIVIRLSDSIRELYEGEDPNDLIVHDGDVLTILNDLKIAGAEILSINGQRILSTSEIKCTGPTITINNHTYGQPFIIKAIGNPETLDAAIKAPGSYTSNLKEVWDLIVESYVSDRVRISRYQGDMTIRHITPLEGE